MKPRAKAPKSKAKKSGQKAPSTFMGRLSDGVQMVARQVEAVFSSEPKDIVEAVKADHEGLRNFLSTLKDTDKPMAERRRAYDAFAALLESHTTAEEAAVYTPTEKHKGHELQIKIAEGYVEHQVSKDLLKSIARTRDPLAWSAHANVIAEIVAHHLKEEERDLLPMIRQTMSPDENAAMLKKFVALREKTQKRVTTKNAGVLGKAKKKN